MTVHPHGYCSFVTTAYACGSKDVVDMQPVRHFNIIHIQDIKL